MRPLVLTASLVVCLAADSSARAANAAKPLGDPHQDRPTLHSLGIYWIVRGDDNQNASVRLDYRKDGSAPACRSARSFASSGGLTSPRNTAAGLTFPTMAGSLPAVS